MPPAPRLLMCPPDHFAVDYVINPWMQGHLKSTDRDRASQQWQALHATLASLAHVALLPAVAGLPDLVFTANAGLVCGDRFVPSRFRHVERQPEEAHDAAWFAAHGFIARPLPDAVAFEGAGDALFDRETTRLWFGHGHRSDLAVAPALTAMLDLEVVALGLVDSRFYHLDTCFCPLSGGYLMYLPAAFDADARAAIERRVPPLQRIVVGEEDALAFACNAVNIGDRVVLNRASPLLRTQLNAAGFEVIEVDVSEFMKAGGAVKCLSLRLDEPARTAAPVLFSQETASRA